MYVLLESKETNSMCAGVKTYEDISRGRNEPMQHKLMVHLSALSRVSKQPGLHYLLGAQL